MATHRLLFSEALPDRATPRAQLSGIAQRDLLPHQDRLPVAQSARELCPVGHGLSLLPNLEAQRFVGGHSYPLAGTGTPSGRAQTAAQRGHHRQPECQEHRDERRAGLRCRQKSQRTQAAYPGRYDRLAPHGHGSARRCSRSGWCQTVAGRLLQPEDSPARQTYLGRRRLHGNTAGMDPQTVALHHRDRQALQPSHLQGVAAPLGGGTHLRLARTLPPTQSRLRTTSRNRRNHGLSGYDSSYAQTSRLRKYDFSNRLSVTALLLRFLPALSLLCSGALASQGGPRQVRTNSPFAAGAGLAVRALRCEWRTEPLGLDVARPRLSWIVEAEHQKSEMRGEKQTAYQVLVASSQERLAKNEGDLW